MVGVQMRKLGVMFRDLRVVGPGVGAAVQHNLASLFYPQSIIEYINTVWHTPVDDTISGFEGVVASRGCSVRIPHLFFILACPRKPPLTQSSWVVRVLDVVGF